MRHKKIEKSKQYIKKQQLRAELKKVKNDLINNTINSDVKYHNWIKLHRPKLLPDILNRTYQDDIDENPQKYIKYMIYMSLELEKIAAKKFNAFPLKKTLIPSYIMLDTKALIEIFFKNKQNKLDNVMHIYDEIWGQIFNMTRKEFHKKGYEFDNGIVTDGKAVTILFVTTEVYAKKNGIKEKMSDCRREAAKLKKTL